MKRNGQSLALAAAFAAALAATGVAKPISCDVCVVGGGSAGFAAALAAAEKGCGTILVEKEPMLGGTSTIAGVNNWEPGCGGDGVPQRVYERLAAIPGACGIWRQTMHSSYGDAFPGALLEIDGALTYADTLRRHGKSMTEDRADWLARYHGIIFEPRQMDAVMRAMLSETGKCRVMLSTSFVSCRLQGGRIAELTLSNGKVIVPKVVVDACGFVAKDAGCETVSSPAPNGVTLVFRVSSRPEAPEIVVPADTPDAPWSGWGASFPQVWCGRYPNGDLMVNMLPTMSGDQARQLGAEQTYEECRRRVFAEWKWMKATYPQHFGDYKITEICSRAAYRDTHRVVCEYTLTGDDVRFGRHFDDEIATADHAFDSHGSSTAYSGELAQPYGIPLRSLKPLGIGNLYVAGRIAGFDTDAASSCRLSRTMMKLGEAAGNAAAAMLALIATGAAGETNLCRQVVSRLSMTAFADVESAYWARGAVVDKNPYSAQCVGLQADLSPFGYVSGYAWSVSSMSREGQAANRQNFYNEVDYAVACGYAWELTEEWTLDSAFGPKWVTLPGYHPHAQTVYEWNLMQSLKNPYVTPYYLMRRAYYPCDWCYWDVGLTRSWELIDRLTMTVTAFGELGNSRHFVAQYGPHPGGDGGYANGLMALNLMVRFDYAVTDWLGFFAFVHQFDVVSEDARDALDANTNPESLKDLTMFGVGVSVKF